MRKYSILTIVCLLLVFLVTSCKKYNYKIDDYILTIEPDRLNQDARVTMEITYKVWGNEAKSDGFKFVGNYTIDSLVCSDETGVITSRIDYLKETKISWQFNPLASGTKKIKANFIVRNFTDLKDNAYKINANWPGVFRVVVEKATYRIPFDFKPKSLEFNEPEKWEHEQIDGKDLYYFIQSPLKKKSIKLQYEI